MQEAIAALSTPPVPSALGVLRLTGEGCVEALEGLFTPLRGGALSAHPPRALVLGELRDPSGALLDRPLATYARAPHSYTGEDTAELHCHGSPAVLTLALEALFTRGVRQAEAGEFTKRAFLNGKLDLLEAEGVADLIDAQTPAAVHSAAGRLAGALSARVAALYDTLVDLLAHFHATVDYPDEDLAPFTGDTVRGALKAALGELEALMATYRRGRALTTGLPCAIVGPPNVGKSTLLNALLGYERAIVTDLPGTTRDTVEETCVLGGVLLRLTDTAGLRQTEDPVERLGVERARQAMGGAELILAVSDQSQPPTPEELALWREAGELAPTLLVRNKADLPAIPLPETDFPLPPTVSGSLREDPEALVAELARAVACRFAPEEPRLGEALTNTRQLSAATQARDALLRALEALEAGLPVEFPLQDTEAALGALGGLLGRKVGPDVVERIFSRFCVGK